MSATTGSRREPPRDVAETTRIEVLLHESEERFRAFVMASSDVVYRMSPDWLEMRRLDGQGFLADTAEPTGSWMEHYILPDDCEMVQRAINQAIRTKSMFELEHRVRRADGTSGWTLSRATPVLNENGAITEWLGAAKDVTARKLAAEVLRASEARFRQFADASSDVLWIRGAGTLRFEYVGPAFEAIYGDSFERVFGGNDLRRWAKLILPEDRKRVLDNFRRVRRGERVTHEFRITRPSDGALRWIRNTDFPLLDDQGRVRSIAGIGQDVTAAKQAEAALQELNTTLEARVEARTTELMTAEAALRQSQKMEAIGQLTGGIAHDFNNMLQGIAGSLDLMRRRAEQGRLVEAARFVDSARETVHRAAALTHRLLAFARQQTLAPVLVNVDELVTGMAELIGRTVGPTVQIEVRLGDGAWPVLCDESQLENALLNLCVNARDAMPDGGWLTISTGELQLSAAELIGEVGLSPGCYTSIAVTDTGAGMDAATQARVFEPFFTTKPSGQGTGLGLSQIYGFVLQSGGLVRLDSAPGEGTTVRLCLPRHEPAVSATDDAAISAVILLVEDEERLRAMAAEWLRDAGYRVMEAPDGAAALRLLHGGGRVDLLASDVGLPGGMNGRQVADAAREHRPGLPVLFMTGYAGSALSEQLAPRMEVLAKPFALEDLAEHVRTMLKTAQTGT